MDRARSDALLGAFRTLADELQHHGFTQRQLVDAIQDQWLVPVEAFGTELTPLEAATKHLAGRGHDVARIAETIGRPPAAVEKVLRSAERKRPGALPVSTSGLSVPARRFADRTVGVSEHIAEHLRDSGLTNAQIAAAIGWDPRTVWTLLDRAKKKRGGAQ